MTSMHQHEHARSDRRLLALALVVLGVFMVAEVVPGILAHSTARLAHRAALGRTRGVRRVRDHRGLVTHRLLSSTFRPRS